MSSSDERKDDGLTPEAPKLLRHIKWFLEFGTKHKGIVGIAILILVTPTLYLHRDQMFSAASTIFRQDSFDHNWLPEIPDGLRTRRTFIGSYFAIENPRVVSERKLAPGQVPTNFYVNSQGVFEGVKFNSFASWVRGLNTASYSIAVACDNWIIIDNNPKPQPKTCELSDSTIFALERLLSLFVAKGLTDVGLIMDRANVDRELGLRMPVKRTPLPEKEINQIRQVLSVVSEMP